MYGKLQLKRPIPNVDVLAKRAEMIRSLGGKSFPSLPSDTSPIGLSLGNSKTGSKGSKFKTVFVWNIPAVTTCPGASKACLLYCYNADERKDKFPMADWANNLAWFNKHPNELMVRINFQLQSSEKPCAVRIHSSGDFFSVPYIKFWHKIVTTHPESKFWCYTRSWQVPDLFGPLQDLHSQPNIELFASWDKTMPKPPMWRLSVVEDELINFQAPSTLVNNVLFCPEQSNRVLNCASCGFCMNRCKKGVLFTLH